MFLNKCNIFSPSQYGFRSSMSTTNRYTVGVFIDLKKGNRRITAHICVRINKEKINRVNSTTVLGVIIDCKLNWKSHILSARSKLSKCCAIMYRASSLINKHGTLYAYVVLFSFHALYYVLC